jgi:5-methylcytosine-specific restriction endonuclease McrA
MYCGSAPTCVTVATGGFLSDRLDPVGNAGSKRCTKCDEEKPAGAFYADKRTKTGLHSQCKDCFRGTSRASYARHREKRQETQRDYQRRRPERRKAAREKWAAKNPDNARERKRRYRERHKEQLAAEWAEYYEANRERLLEARRGRDWRKHYDPVKWAEYARQRRARLLEAFVAPVDEAEIVIRDGGLCGICGEPADGPVEIDHVFPLSRGGTHEPDNVQLAHRLCNRKKHARLDYEPDGLAA